MLLRLGDVAAVLQVSRRHVEALVAAGSIRSIRIGRCRRVARAELERIAREGLVAAALG